MYTAIDYLKNPLSLCLQDDYQSPEVLSLHSLNLESSVETTPGGSLSPTTYRESYKWQARRNMFHSSSRSPNPGDGGSCRNNQHGDSDSSARSNGMSSSGTLDCREQTHTGRTTQTSHTKANLRQTYLAQGQNTKVCDSVGSFGRAQGSGQRSLLKRNDSSSFKATTNGGQISSTTSIKSSASSSDDSVSVTSAREKVVPVKPAGRSEAPAPTVQASGNLQTVRESSGRGQKPSVKTEAPRVPNGTAGSGNNDSASRTEPRSRAYQLQSSTGGSPFVYGSDSGYWVWSWLWFFSLDSIRVQILVTVCDHGSYSGYLMWQWILMMRQWVERVGCKFQLSTLVSPVHKCTPRLKPQFENLIFPIL